MEQLGATSQLSLQINLIQELAEIPSVTFVGGTSEFIQGFRKDLKDIDISIPNPDILRKFGYVFRGENNSLYGLSGKRGFIKNNGTLIDIFIDPPPEFIMVGEFKCETVESMLNLSRKTLKHNSMMLSANNLDKLINRVHRLESYTKKAL